MTVLPSSTTTSSDESPPLAELRRLKSQAQNGEHRRQLRRKQREAAKKAEHKDNKQPDPEPQQFDTNKPKRKKRGFFKWLFEPAVSTSRKVAPPPAPTVRVKIPIVYRNGEHKGVVVGGLRVPFSRPMQANRRSLLLAQDDARFGIPEDAELVLDFPDRLAWEAYEAEQSRKQEEKQRLKVEKLARELAK